MQLIWKSKTTMKMIQANCRIQFTSEDIDFIVAGFHHCSYCTNVVHGSDAPETAAFELGYFFPGLELAR